MLVELSISLLKILSRFIDGTYEGYKSCQHENHNKRDSDRFTTGSKFAIITVRR